MEGTLAKKRAELRFAETEYRQQSPKSIRDRYASWYALVVVLFVIDRLLKELALVLGPSKEPGLVSFSLFRNEGIAFSLPLPPAVFWPAAAVFFILLVGYFLMGVRRDRRRAAIAFTMILGAVSNLWDRWQHGATIDYLLFFGRSAVNLADGMIIFGLVALFVLKGKDEPQPPSVSATGA